MIREANTKMAIPMRPWFCKLRKMPEIIKLPPFFFIEQQKPHGEDLKKLRALHAERMRFDRVKKALEDSNVKITTTAVTDED